jgi:hypothetical protein
MRDRNIRNAIQTALVATGAFDGVWISGLPENYGTGSSQIAAAAIEPLYSREDDRWDSQTTGGIIIASRLMITLLYRHDDPQVRDETVEMLLNTAAAALNGQSLTGLTICEFTKFTSWTWENPTPPERRIKATFEYSYIVEGWANLDTTP